MSKEIIEILLNLKPKHLIDIVTSGDGEVVFTVEGIQDRFVVTVDSGDWIVSGELWHEHVENGGELGKSL